MKYHSYSYFTLIKSYKHSKVGLFDFASKIGFFISKIEDKKNLIKCLRMDIIPSFGCRHPHFFFSCGHSFNASKPHGFIVHSKNYFIKPHGLTTCVY